MTTTETVELADDFEPFDRDRWQRPLILDQETGEMVPYTRTSTFAGVLTSKYLATYQMWWGLRVRHMFPEESMSLAAHAEYPKGDPGLKLLNTLGHKAGMNEKRDRGQSRHTLVRWALTGRELPADMPEQAERELRAVAAAVSSLGQITGTEVPIVNDELKVAGSADYIGMDADGKPFVADLKTGGMYGDSGIEWALQLVGYARGQLWDREQRKRLGFVCAQQPDLFIVHAPQDRPDKITLHRLDVAEAMALAQTAALVIAARQAKPIIQSTQVVQ